MDFRFAHFAEYRVPACFLHGDVALEGCFQGVVRYVGDAHQNRAVIDFGCVAPSSDREYAGPEFGKDRLKKNEKRVAPNRKKAARDHS